jgi:hypothetical protein
MTVPYFSVNVLMAFSAWADSAEGVLNLNDL